MTSRIIAITDAATYLFLRQGYSKTQISHIAKAVGVSVGTIYHDFIGKKEIMQYILKCTIDPEFPNYEIKTPISDELFMDLEKDIIKAFEQNASDFENPLKAGINNYSFEMMISDFKKEMITKGNTVSGTVGDNPIVTIRVETKNGDIEVTR